MLNWYKKVEIAREQNRENVEAERIGLERLEKAMKEIERENANKRWEIKPIEPWDNKEPLEKPFYPWTDMIIGTSVCDRCPNNMKNGGSGVCCCALPYMTSTARITTTGGTSNA